MSELTGQAVGGDFFSGGGTPAAFGKDDPVGLTVSGAVVSADERQQTDFQSGKPLTWDNGDPRMQLVVVIQTDEHDPMVEDDDGQRAIYVKGSKKAGSQSLYDAVATALRTAGTPLLVGGILTVSYVGNEPSSTRGMSDRKLWKATYTPPQAGAAQQPAQAATPAQPQAPAQQAAAPTQASAPAAPSLADQARSLHNAGQAPAAIAAILGIDESAITTILAA